jgi:uncharacterized protein
LSDDRALQPSTEAVIAATKTWIEKAVIGLQLCPFASHPYLHERVRYRVSEHASNEALLDELSHELRTLQETNPLLCETTLLIHPRVLNDFTEYNQFLGDCDAALDRLGLQGELQIASFHPRYRFAGTGEDDIENYTNRSPYPMLHLLREASVSRAVESFEDIDEIGTRNIRTLQALGHDGWRRLWSSPS